MKIDEFSGAAAAVGVSGTVGGKSTKKKTSNRKSKRISVPLKKTRKAEQIKEEDVNSNIENDNSEKFLRVLIRKSIKAYLIKILIVDSIVS